MPIRKFKCAFCKGSGIQPHTLRSPCSVCRGKGEVKFEGPVIQCPVCHGQGSSGYSGLSCARCRGVGVIKTNKEDTNLGEIVKLGKYLKQLRDEQKLSIRAVAKSCSLAPSYLAKIEIGDTYKTIGIETLVKLSKFYGIPVSSMLKQADFIDSHESDLPELAQYLRLKYQLPYQAIRDMAMAKEIVDKKYPRK